MNFLDQIRNQPERLRLLAEDLGGSAHPLRSAECERLVARPRVVLTGMGSSLYACYPAYLRLAAHGRAVTMWETAELVHFSAGNVNDQTALIAVSQSGETAEILALLDRMPESFPLIAVTNERESTLARRAAVVLLLGTEHSTFAATQTYLNSLALLLAVARVAAGEALGPFAAALTTAAAALEAFIEESFLRDHVSIDPGSHLVCLARGPSLASAQQAALMFHEVAGRGAAALSAPAFRHGPVEMAGPGLSAVVFEPYGPTAALVEDLAGELEGFGARVIRIADARLGRGDFRHRAMDEELAPLVNLAPVQALACAGARQRGREPGCFRQAQSVTTRE